MGVKYIHNEFIMSKFDTYLCCTCASSRQLYLWIGIVENDLDENDKFLLFISKKKRMRVAT